MSNCLSADGVAAFRAFCGTNPTSPGLMSGPPAPRQHGAASSGGAGLPSAGPRPGKLHLRSAQGRGERQAWSIRSLCSMQVWPPFRLGPFVDFDLKSCRCVVGHNATTLVPRRIWDTSKQRKGLVRLLTCFPSDLVRRKLICTKVLVQWPSQDPTSGPPSIFIARGVV